MIWQLQAASCKLQAASCKLQAASCKLQAASRKPKAESYKRCLLTASRARFGALLRGVMGGSNEKARHSPGFA
ncbi:hypothetical protein [Pseudomonas tohonis]|uniref:hypothetical protein n=1 Tax=Pseudomonas tohonis TaxID=2725477 RepID=UPI001F183BD5|nr:hypothetical protein [Pseudomonas tohonis]